MKEMSHTKLNLMDALIQRIEIMTTIASTPDALSEVLLWPVNEFLHDPRSDVAFQSWFKRCRRMFAVDLADRDDDVRLHPRKLGSTEHMRYVHFILWDEPFLFKFVMDEVKENDLGRFQDAEVDLGNGRKLFDPDYAE